MTLLAAISLTALFGGIIVLNRATTPQAAEIGMVAIVFGAVAALASVAIQ